MAQKITHWLLITLILSLGFGQLLRFDFYDIPLYLHDVLVVAILLFQLYKVTNLVIPIGLKIFFLGLALGWLRALSLYSIFDLLVPFFYTLRLLAYLVLFVSLKQSKISIPYSIFSFSGIATLVIGLSQYILLPDMRVFQYLGWDDHLNRLALPHFDPTFTAVMLVLFMLSSLRLKSIFDILVLPFTTIAILLTYSRSVWLSLALTALPFLRFKKVLLLIPIFLVAIYMLPQRFGEGTNLLRTYSISSRFNTDSSYVQKYKWDLLIGRGMNTLVLDSEPSMYEDHATGPNNSYLYLLTTTGVLGLVGWILFLKSIYQKSTHKPMIIFFAVASLFNNVMFYPFALLWVLLIEAMVPSEA
jgi:hypothetical protein